MLNKPSQQQPAEGERLKIQNPKDYAIKLAQKEVPSYGAKEEREDWEALYISEHLNLLAAKGRIAELEKQLALNK